MWRPMPFRGPEIQPALPEKLKTLYEYPKQTGIAETVSETVIKHYRLKTVEIPLELPEDLKVKALEDFKSRMEELFKTDQKTAKDQMLRYKNRIDLYIPKNIKHGEKRPVILISPILGGNMVVDRFAIYYAGRGYIAALVHRKRLFWDDGEDMMQMEKYMRSSVIRLRQALDYLETVPEADGSRIGGFGVSYGAVLHSILAAVEPRVKYHVLAMPAGPIAEVIMGCPDKAVTKIIKHVREKYGWSDEKIFTDLKAVIQTDPMYLAPYVPKDKVTIYVALFDRVVGAGRSFGLWKAMDKPKLKILPFGHYGGVVVFPYLQTQSYQAFKKSFKKTEMPN